MKKSINAAKPYPQAATNYLLITVLSTSLFLFASCQKDISKPGVEEETNSTVSNSIELKQTKKVYVATLDELYTAVNDPNNEGGEVVIAPGTYTLNASFPNGGRLEFQPDMTLKGLAGDPSAVVIDQSSLPAASFTIPAGRTGGIRMGRGTNTIEWMSLIGGVVAANPFSVINTDLLSTETNIIISHVYVNSNGSNLGINLRNRLAEHANRKIYAELTDNEITGGVNFNGFALAIQNANGSSGALISVTMRNNYIHGNKVGILAFSSAQTITLANCVIDVKSYNDRIEGNGVGIDPNAGVNQASTTTANNNFTSFKMYGTSIRDNNPSPLPPALTPVNGALPGGIYAAAAYNSVNNISGFNRASDNTMRLEFHGCDISNNGAVDIYAYGAWSPPATVLAGSNNLLDVYLYGLSANAIVNSAASEPVEPAGTNVVNVVRN